MFQENDAFNRDISKWNVKSGTTFKNMFLSAKKIPTKSLCMGEENAEYSLGKQYV